ncbi:MAG: CoA ester lyase [Nitrospirae bacterium]|nr:CoA ester lyase [Nitrospirota bacterium]
MFVLDDGKRVVVPRTELTYPGHDMKFHRNAADPVKSPVDLVMADLEDACPYEFKGDVSRKTIVEAFNTLNYGPKVVTFRPNNIKSSFFEADVRAVVTGAPNRFHGIILPKIFGPEDVRLVDKLLTECEKQAGWTYKIQIETLIENPVSLENAYEIAASSPRMAGLIFGIADYASWMRIRNIVEDQNVNFGYAKQRVCAAAKAHGLHAIDNVFLRLPRKGASPEDVAAIERGIREKNMGAAALGMDGTWVIHPSQAAISNECYTPSKDEIDNAKRVIELYHEQGGGAMFDHHRGEMVDEATAKMALGDLSKGVQAGLVEAAYLADKAARSAKITGYDILKAAKEVRANA